MSAARGTAGVRVDRRELAAVFAGGVIGTIARAAVGDLAAPGAGRWPWATMSVNLLGAALLGFLATRVPAPASGRRLFVGTGFCGALTTFSTMQIELLGMLDRGDYGLAGAYAAVSVVGGFLAVGLATGLARRGRAAG